MKITLEADDLKITKEIRTEQELEAAMKLFKSKSKEPEIQFVSFLNWGNAYGISNS